MNVIKSFSIALVSSFLVSSSILAADSDKSNANAAENNVREQFANVLSGVGIEEPSAVYVIFKASNGKLEVLFVKGDDEQLTAQVKETLNNSKISLPANLDGKFSIKVNFITR